MPLRPGVGTLPPSFALADSSFIPGPYVPSQSMVSQLNDKLGLLRHDSSLLPSFFAAPALPSVRPSASALPGATFPLKPSSLAGNPALHAPAASSLGRPANSAASAPRPAAYTSVPATSTSATTVPTTSPSDLITLSKAELLQMFSAFQQGLAVPQLTGIPSGKFFPFPSYHVCCYIV